jgi:23S rRNA (uracil1939-C5)-methyltransferase
MEDIIKDVRITGVNSSGRGVGRSPNYDKVLFVKQGVQVETVDVKITKQEKTFVLGDIVNISAPSSQKVKPPCIHYEFCGGCNIQHLNYGAQLEVKAKQVEDALLRIAKLENANILNIIPSPKEFYYRNKMDYQFSNLSWIINPEGHIPEGKIDRRVLGLHVEGRYDRVLDIKECLMQGDTENKIRNFIREFAMNANASFYNPKYKKGLMRNLQIKTNSKGDIMVLIIFGEPPKTLQADLCAALIKEFPQITSLYYGVNKKEEDLISDIKLFAYKGNEYLYETLHSVTYKVNAKSFFQINISAAEILISKILESSMVNNQDLVYDLYSGVGTFSLQLAKRAKKVIGIESNKQSVSDAIENATLNKITNTKFIVGEIKSILNEDFIAENGKPEIIIMDPPRSGANVSDLTQILKAEAKKIIYISCNPATLARDISFLKETYTLTSVLPLDMFPQTVHVESIAILEIILA